MERRRARRPERHVEYTNTELMFAGFTPPHHGKTGLTRAQAEVDLDDGGEIGS